MLQWKRNPEVFANDLESIVDEDLSRSTTTSTEEKLGFQSLVRKLARSARYDEYPHLLKAVVEMC